MSTMVIGKFAVIVAFKAATPARTLASGGTMQSRRHYRSILCLYEDTMTNQSILLSEPMPKIMSLDEAAAKLKF